MKNSEIKRTFQAAGLAGEACEFKNLALPRILPAGPEPKPIFVGIRKTVMQGDKCVGVMCSKTMAKRTANALNRHKPNREGV